MPIFQCDNCGTAENTALTKCNSSNLELRVENQTLLAEYRLQLGLTEDEPFGKYCSACCPLGEKEWHGSFDRIYLPLGKFETAPNGNLRHKDSHDENLQNYAIDDRTPGPVRHTV